MKIFVLGTRGFPDVQGGVEKHCQELYTRLARCGNEITIFNRSPYFAKGSRLSRYEGVNLIYLWCPRSKNLETVFHTFIGVILCILKRPDVAHFHNIGPAFFIPLLRLFGIRTVLTYHSSNYSHLKWNAAVRLLLSSVELMGILCAHRVIVVSKAKKRFLEEKYNRRDFYYIPNGVSTAVSAQKDGILEKYGLERGKYIIAVSRFSPEKGLTDLISAYKKLNNPAFRLAIVGGADYETSYSRNIKKMAASEPGIVLTGFLYNEYLKELYTNAGLFVLPSYDEGLSISLLEALSFGLPVLASDIAPNREVLGPQGSFFKAGDVEALAEKLPGLMQKVASEDARSAQAAALRKRYSWDAACAETMEVYKKISK